MVRGWRFPGLTLKLLIALVGTTALISAAQGYLTTRRHQQDLRGQIAHRQSYVDRIELALAGTEVLA